MVQRTGSESYRVQLIGFDGAGGPSVKPVARFAKTYIISTPCPPTGITCIDDTSGVDAMPETSISLTHVYFLDGETRVKALSMDGTVSTIKDIAAPPNSQVVFSVSPDDSRMAVSIITLATSFRPAGPFTDHMYVEDLTTTANRVDLYSSTTAGKWPVGWHAGNLVVGLGSPDPYDLENPYGVIGYELVDPRTGRTLAALDCSQGLLVSAGTACVTGGCSVSTSTTCVPSHLFRQNWDGTKQSLALPACAPQNIVTGWRYTELSPQGVRVSAELVTDPATSATEAAVIQAGAIIYSTDTGVPLGWLDESHLLLESLNGLSIVDLRTGRSTPVVGLAWLPKDGNETFMGAMPEALG
jgi:hypothetical protein